jgi:HAMP domain-containing protein
MSSRLGALVPSRISSQLAVLIVASVVAIHLVLFASFVLSRKPEDFGGPAALHGRIAALVHLIAASEPTERPGLLAAMARTHPGLDLRLEPGSLTSASDHARDFHLDMLARSLGPGFHLALLARLPSDPERSPARIVIRLPDDTILTALLSLPQPPPGLRAPWITALFLIISMGLLGLWAARALTSPLRDLARAAEDFRLDRDPARLPERGPDEIRSAARALNHMQAGIRKLVDDRTRMLAAVGHDLRTPITRLRLRAEFIEESEARRQMLRDLDQMQAMVDSVLTFLRDGRGRTEPAFTDIATLSVANQVVRLW